MKELFLPYKLSILARDKGFDEPCLAFYAIEDMKSENYDIRKGLLYPVEQQYYEYGSVRVSDTEFKTTEHVSFVLAAPLYQQIVDFCREKHKLAIYVNCLEISGKSWWKISKLYDDGVIKGYSGFEDSYYKALDKAIEQAFKLI